MSDKIAILEKLDKRNKELASLIDKYERDNNPERYDLKEELYNNKIEMINIIKNGDSVASITTLEDEIKQYKSMPKKPKYETGIQLIDNHFSGGLELSQLILLGGEKGAGKSAFALQYLLNVAQGFKSCFFSFEMPKWKMAQRLDKSNPSREQLKNFYLIDKDRDIVEISRNIRKLVKDGIQFFCIDSLMKISNATLRNAPKHEQISNITATLSKLAVELDIIIILIVQINKEDLKGGNLAVKGSGDAEYDADIMFFIKKDKDDISKRYFICNKNRQTGNEFNEEVYFNPAKIVLQQQKPSYIEVCTVTTYSATARVDAGFTL